jgi:hypothetical protein
MYKPGLHVPTDQVFNAYVRAVKQQGAEIREVTDLLFKYSGTCPAQTLATNRNE